MKGRALSDSAESNSVDPTVAALQSLPAGSVALVAMHSGTFCKFLLGLGIETPDVETDEGLFPKGEDFKISTFVVGLSYFPGSNRFILTRAHL